MALIDTTIKYSSVSFFYKYMKSIMTEKKYAKIYFRIFPTEKMIWDYLKVLDDHKTIYIRCLQQLAKSKEHVVPTFWTFRTDNVFVNHTQKQIYNDIVPEVLDNISRGYDAILMAYGQTGTGKSLTVNGLQNAYEERGILTRITSDVFNNLKAEASKNNLKMCIQVSYAEFSRTTVNDLLKPYPNHVTSLKNINKMKVKTVEDAFRIIFTGEGRKTFSENCPYLSHLCSSIFTFYIYTRNSEMQNNATQKRKLHIVDLAGVDTVGNFTCLFKNSHEVGAGNLAKTQLEQFFLVLCSNIPEKIKIKQRLNPMIHYLGDSLKKTTILRFVGHIRVSKEDLFITISMLRFGELIGGLKATKYELSVDRDASQERVNDLQKELTKLKLESKYNSILMHQDLVKSLSVDRIAHIERTVNEYLQNKITHLTLLNVCDVNIALEVLKMLYKKREEDKNGEKKDNNAASATKVKRLSSASNKIQQKSSRGSNKSASSEKMMKRSNDGRSSSRKLRSGSADLRLSSRDKMSSLHETGSRRSKTASNSSLLKRQVSDRRKSSSSRASGRERSHETLLMDHIPPEYSEAWNFYMKERSDEYSKLVDIYRNNETAAKNTYSVYLKELENLKEITARVDKHKNELFMAKMTREFQHSIRLEAGKMMLSAYEECVMKELQRSEAEQLEKKELVLKCQAELKAHIKVCNDQKKILSDDFNAYCQEKYQAAVVNLESSEIMPMNIEHALGEQEVETHEAEVELENPEATAFENLKQLIGIERRKKEKYQMQHRQWLTY